MRELGSLTAASLLVTASLAAQQPAPATAASTCTYDTCALRLEQRRVLQGAEGQPILTLGPWGAPSLRPHVGHSDSALAYAAEFDQHYTVGRRVAFLGLLGAAVMGALYANSVRSSDDLADRELAGHLGGIALSFGLPLYGGRRLDRAMRGLSRAIWWSNRELPR